MRTLIKTFKALSDQNRLRILKMLEIRPLCVCEITEVLQLANSTVSKHLSVLRDVELILDEKEGKWVNYRLNKGAPDESRILLLELIKNNFVDSEIIQNDLSKVKKVDRTVICSI